MQVFEPVSLTVRGSGPNSQNTGSTSSESLLPRYSCLLISPGNFWHNDQNKFSQDPSILKTLHEIHHEGLVPSVSIGHLREVLFGVPWKETGIRKMYLTTRQRTITYAVTVILSKYDPEFISSLKQSLEERYPLHFQVSKFNSKSNSANRQGDTLNNGHPSSGDSQSSDHERDNNSSSPSSSSSSHMLPPSASPSFSSPHPSLASQEPSHGSTSNGLGLNVTNVNSNSGYNEEARDDENIIHLYFQVKISYTEYILRATMYLLVFLYVLFSVRKYCVSLPFLALFDSVNVLNFATLLLRKRLVLHFMEEYASVFSCILYLFP